MSVVYESNGNTKTVRPARDCDSQALLDCLVGVVQIILTISFGFVMVGAGQVALNDFRESETESCC